MYIVLIILLSVVVLYILSTRCRRGHPGLSGLQGWSYAHRGLHGNGVPENSLQAFSDAVNAGYGSELDVHLLADNNLAVIHDSLLKRTTGAEGKIEDLCAEQLGEYYLEGTNQTIPLLSQVLEIYSGKAPLIVELKPVDNNIDTLCRRTCDLLDKYDGVFCVESFDPRCVRWFTLNRPDIVRGQLTENFFRTSNSKLPGIIKFIMKAQMLNFLTRPDFVAYRFSDRKNISNYICRNIWGAQGVTWTLKSIEEYVAAENENWIPIFEDFSP